MAENRFEKCIYAHRGGIGPFPENSLEMFRIALQEGADGIEIDVRKTRDNKMIVFHDPDGRRMTSSHHRVAGSTLDEVRTWKLKHSKSEEDADYQVHRIPTLNEALEAFPNTVFSIDIKDKGLEPVAETIKIIRQHNAQHRCRLGSFSQANYDAILHYGYEGPILLGQRELMKLFFLPAAFNSRQYRSIDVVCVPESYGPLLLNRPRFIERCHQKGLRIDYWVINAKEIALQLLDRGADGFVTDETASLVRICKDWTLARERADQK